MEGMGGFNLLEAACRRLVAAGQQPLMGEKTQDALKAHVYPAPMPAASGSGAFPFSTTWNDNATYHQRLWLPWPYTIFNNLKIVHIYYSVSSAFCIMTIWGICRLVIK